MDLDLITVADFKDLFYRDFPYLPIYSSTQLYNTGDEVYYPTNLLFYTALINGLIGITPGTDGAKWQLTADSIYNYVQDRDITAAFREAKMIFNQGIFGTDEEITLAYLYLTAHYLCNDIRASLAGISGSGTFPVSSRNVGSVSESYDIPVQIKDSAALSQYTASSYGMKYLSFLLPNLTGNVVAVFGGTQP